MTWQMRLHKRGWFMEPLNHADRAFLESNLRSGNACVGGSSGHAQGSQPGRGRSSTRSRSRGQVCVIECQVTSVGAPGRLGVCEHQGLAKLRNVPEDASQTVALPRSAQGVYHILFNFVSVTSHKVVLGRRTHLWICRVLSSIPTWPSALLALLSGSGNPARALGTEQDS